ncbi:carbon starvation protein A [Candidatus Sumerlaeota bacterium]|nr:carbon starvation protein A [Candidatus Sumerlaeota bacterium]
MTSILIAFGVGVLYLIAYNTYGKFLARKLFQLDDSIETPAHALRDDVDYCPASKEVLFGHHFTSIAGTGPIVGPAIAVIWGWLPALLWVLFGSILMGAVHDFSSIALSARYQGRTIGDIARDVINPRARLLFLLVIFFALAIVIAIFGLVIAVLFKLYPQSVIPVWIELPIAILIGWLVYRRDWRALPLSLTGVAALYIAIQIGAVYPVSTQNVVRQGTEWAAPVKDAEGNLPAHTHLELGIGIPGEPGYRVLLRMPSLGWMNAVAFWTILLLIYAYVASTLPVWLLLQPRDYLNSHQLFIALGLLMLGIIAAHPEFVAPALRIGEVQDAPPVWPFLFITVACGAISGFHSLVGSGTTSKQLDKQSHALSIGYGGMLMEGLLATLVILACCAGLGLATDESGLSGSAVWASHYASWNAANGLGPKVGAFINGSAKMMERIGAGSWSIPHAYALTLMGVFVVSFAATTLDTATRLQRYVVSELANSLNIKPLSGKHAATTIAVITGGWLALGIKGPDGSVGSGGMTLWPLFGATNQLLACLALLVITIWLKRTGRSMAFTLPPLLFMAVMTGWAMVIQLGGFFHEAFPADPDVAGKKLHLLLLGGAILALELWMVIEAVIVFCNAPVLGEEASAVDASPA